MTQEKVSPLRERMIEDMRIRGMGDKSQKAHIRALKDFSAFLGRSPDTAEPDDLRAYQFIGSWIAAKAIRFLQNNRFNRRSACAPRLKRRTLKIPKLKRKDTIYQRFLPKL